MPADSTPFHLLVIGPFARERVSCELSTERVPRNPQTDALIDAAWVDRLALASARGQQLFPGPMCGLRSWEAGDAALSLHFGLTDYREFVGTNVANPNIAERFGERFLANGAGVCSVLLTADDQLILQRRSQTVFEHPGMLHFCGGSLNPDDANGLIRADPFAVMAREFDEEIGITESSIALMDCLGLARDSHTLKPDVMLRTRVLLSADEVLRAAGDEHSELLAVPSDAIAVTAWLERHWSDIAPAGLACLVAYIACTGSRAYANPWLR